MPEKPAENSTMCAFRIRADKREQFDRRIKRAGFASRTDFFTALVRLITESPEAQNPFDLAKNWAATQMPPLSEDRIQTETETAIRKHLFAVIAVHGADIAFERTWKDLRRIIHDKTHLWLTASELKTAYTRFEDQNRRQLTDYKTETLENP